MTLRFLRRLHLYLGLILMPWVAMYGLSSFFINHQATGSATWTHVATHAFETQVPSGPDGMRRLGARMMATAETSGGFFVARPEPTRYVLNGGTILRPVRLTYDVDRGELRVERRQITGRSLLVSLHTRSALLLGGTGNVIWAAAVDLAALGLLTWIATGLVMWWTLPASPRRWGWFALAAGAMSLLAIVMGL